MNRRPGNRTGFLILIVLFTLVVNIHISLAAPVSIPVQENFSIRRQYEEVIFGDMPWEAGESYHKQIGTGRIVKVETTVQDEKGFMIFMHKIDSTYRRYNRGTYILQRDGLKLERISIYYQNHQECFIQFHEEKGMTIADLYLYGQPYYQSVKVPLTLRQVALKPFSELVGRTSRLIDWEFIFPHDRIFGQERIRHMVDSLREGLHHLHDADDGALDAEGNWVYIDSLEPNPQGGLNCSGFAKWVVDGVYGYFTSRGYRSGNSVKALDHGEVHYLSVQAMKQKHPETRGNRWSEQYEDARDPYFGLDWTRNLAVSVLNLRKPKSDIFGIEDADVRYESSAGYVEDVGYAIEKLRMVLYMDAVLHPGHFYLGSVNTLVGDDPALRQHTHVAVFFPYFEKDGIFRLVVMERNRETEIETFLARNAQNHVHLTRIEVPERIFLPLDIHGASINR